MKQLFVFVSFVVLLVGCTSNTDQQQEVENEQNNASEEELVKESDQAIQFSEVNVIIQNQTLYVTGITKLTNDTFYYTVEQGGDTLIEETEVQIEDFMLGDWHDFEIKRDISMVDPESDETAYIKLYIKDGDREINPNYVPFDLLFF